MKKIKSKLDDWHNEGRRMNFSDHIEDYWDSLCSELGILEDKEKQDIIKEYGRRVKQYYKHREQHEQ